MTPKTRAQLEAIDNHADLLEGLLETAPVSLVIYDMDGRPVYSNPHVERTFGSPPPREYDVREDQVLTRQGVTGMVRRAFEGHTVELPPAWYDVHGNEHIDTSAVTRGRIGIQATLFPLRDGERAVKNVAIWGLDVTSELELRLREERQHLAFAAARVVALDTNATRGTVHLSDDAREILRLPDDVPLATLDDLLARIHPEDKGAFAALERGTGDGARSDDLLFRLLRPDGTLMWMERRGRAWLDDVTGDWWRRGIVLDVSERVAHEEALRQAEEKLLQAQKLEAIGRLAGGIAHDFNNLLSVILSYGSHLLSTEPLSASAREGIEAIGAAGQRAATLTKQLLAVGRQQVLELTVIDLDDVVRSTLTMLRGVLGADIDVVIGTTGAAKTILADAGQIEQVVMNLAINARDAMPTGGRLSLETRHVLLDEAGARAHLDLAPGPHVLLRVSDTGEGMSPSTQAHIFEPFFTTKGMGEGTGLGLATVLGIVQQSRGSIRVQSEPGLGTTFELLFPLASSPAASAGGASSSSPGSGRSNRST